MFVEVVMQCVVDDGHDHVVDGGVGRLGNGLDVGEWQLYVRVGARRRFRRVIEESASRREGQGCLARLQVQ